MRTTATSATLPLIATIGGDGVSAQARVTATTTETGPVYELDLTLEHDANTTPAAPLPPTDIAEVVAFIGALDPRQLADAADRASTSIADDPTALVRDLIAQLVDQTFTPEPAP